jgi:hypothetical protein
MLRELLKRDMRLHWDILVMPYGVLALMMGGAAISDGAVAAAGSLLMGVLFVPFLPLAIHLRENSQGTLGDILTLPCSRRDVVRLRFLELAILGLALLTMIHLAIWITQSLEAHALVKPGLMNREGAFMTCLLLVSCFAYPLPITLRWNGKGLAVAMIILWAVLSGIVILPVLFPPEWKGLYLRDLFTSIEYCMHHPGLLALGSLALMGVSYLVSLKLFAGRDF